MFLASLRSDRKIYQSTSDILEAGAIPLYDISPECAYIKLLLACAQDELSITEFMEFGR
jgi:L-asparaginase/Glu-tRNA(Gln) amidotransferase subunit D